MTDDLKFSIIAPPSSGQEELMEHLANQSDQPHHPLTTSQYFGVRLLKITQPHPSGPTSRQLHIITTPDQPSHAAFYDLLIRKATALLIIVNTSAQRLPEALPIFDHIAHALERQHIQRQDLPILIQYHHPDLTSPPQMSQIDDYLGLTTAQIPRIQTMPHEITAGIESILSHYAQAERAHNPANQPA